jgi:hypothetical protein
MNTIDRLLSLLVLGLLAGFSVSVGAQGRGGGGGNREPDAYEPNDTSNQATFLGMYGADTNEGFLCGTATPILQTFQGNFHSNRDDSDWFSAVAREDSDCASDLAFGGTLSDIPVGNDYELLLYILPEGGEPMLVTQGDITASYRVEDTYNADDTTTFLIEVRRVSGRPTGDLYTLTLRWK